MRSGIVLKELASPHKAALPAVVSYLVEVHLKAGTQPRALAAISVWYIPH